MRVLMALALMASPALAQQPPQQDRGTDFMVQRLKDRLKLSDDQAAKLKEILTKEAEDRTKMDDARTEKINALLDADQKKLYEEMRTNQRGFRGGGPGGPGGNQFQFGGGQGRGMGQLQIDDLKRELSLTDEQVEKIKPLYDEFNAGVQKRMEELRDKGFQGLNLAEEMQKGMDSMKGLAEKVKVHLTDEQKPKLDALTERTTGWMRMIPNLMNQGGRGGAAQRPSVEDRVRSVIGALKIEKDDERSAVADLVAKIVKAQYELEDFIKSSREKLSEAAKNRELSDAAVEDRIKEAQEDRRTREKLIAGYQKQLAEVVTNRQELELMAQGILK
jgi:Spy/CpxP family protein refolding chaperone